MFLAIISIFFSFSVLAEVTLSKSNHWVRVAKYLPTECISCGGDDSQKKIRYEYKENPKELVHDYISSVLSMSIDNNTVNDALNDKNISDKILIYEQALEKSLSFEYDENNKRLKISDDFKTIINNIKKNSNIDSPRIKELKGFVSNVLESDKPSRLSKEIENLFDKEKISEVSLSLSKALTSIDQRESLEFLRHAFIKGNPSYYDLWGVLDIVEETYESPKKSYYQMAIISFLADNSELIQSASLANGDSFICSLSLSLAKSSPSYNEKSIDEMEASNWGKAFAWGSAYESIAGEVSNEFNKDNMSKLIFFSKLGFNLSEVCSDGYTPNDHLKFLESDKRLAFLSTEDRAALGLLESDCYRLSELNLGEVCDLAKISQFIAKSVVRDELNSKTKSKKKTSRVYSIPSEACSVSLFNSIVKSNQNIEERQKSIKIGNKNFDNVNFQIFLSELKNLVNSK